MKTLQLKPGKERSLLRRHPWIFEGSVDARASERVGSGETVRIVGSDGKFLAIGAFSPQSQIRARVWSFDESVIVDHRFFKNAVRAALERRRALPIDSDALRVVHGESDGLPGLIVDVYGQVAVAQFTSAGTERWKDAITQAVLSELKVSAVYERSDSSVRKLEGLQPAQGWLHGPHAGLAGNDAQGESSDGQRPHPPPSPADAGEGTKPASRHADGAGEGAKPASRHADDAGDATKPASLRTDTDADADAGTGSTPKQPSRPGERDTLVQFTENGLRFEVDIATGHKTGFYLDQRDNRALFARVVRQARLERVLNCYCYTGGFSLAALAGGARHVTSVDSSAPALEQARRHVALNGFDAAACTFLDADVNATLRHLRTEHQLFDAIVLDPPKFAPSAAHTERAARAYKDINRLAFHLLRPGGFLFTFSCSGGIDPALFQKIVAGAAGDAGADAAIVARVGAGHDHPHTLAFPEGEYLKGLLLQRL